MSRDSRRQSGTPAFSHTPPQNPGNGYGPGTPQHPGQQHSGQQFPGQQFQGQQGQQFQPGSHPNHPQGRGPKQKKPFFKRVWVWLLIVVVAIIVIASMSGVCSSSRSSRCSPSAAGVS